MAQRTFSGLSATPILLAHGEPCSMSVWALLMASARGREVSPPWPGFRPEGAVLCAGGEHMATWVLAALRWHVRWQERWQECWHEQAAGAVAELLCQKAGAATGREVVSWH